MVTVNDSPPAMVPAVQVTRLPFAPPWAHEPFVLVMISCGSAGGVWITPRPLTWSLRTTLLIVPPAVFLTTIVYVSCAPEAIELALADFVTVIGLAGSARASPP